MANEAMGFRTHVYTYGDGELGYKQISKAGSD